MNTRPQLAFCEAERSSENGTPLNQTPNSEFMRNISKYKRILYPDPDSEERCCVIFNFSRPRIEYCCQGVQELLGFKPKELTVSNFFRLIHPDDASEYISNEFKVNELLRQLPEQERYNYKIQQVLRLKHASGKFMRIKQEIIAIPNKSDDQMLRVFIMLSESKMGTEDRFRISPLRIREKTAGTVRQINPEPEPRLTPREREVLSLIAKNKSSKEIAQALTRSVHTIKNHRKNMLRKTGASNSLELVMLAVRKGWI